MDQRSSVALALAFAVGCATTSPRAELRAGTPVVITSPPPPKASPSQDLVLVNPLECATIGSGHDPFFVVLGILCLPVLVAVDLVALPILVANSGSGDRGYEDGLAATCGPNDPAKEAATQLAEGLVTAHGLVQAPAPGADAPAAAALRLSVATASFSRTTSVR
jgi:hypothetical protein